MTEDQKAQRPGYLLDPETQQWTKIQRSNQKLAAQPEIHLSQGTARPAAPAPWYQRKSRPTVPGSAGTVREVAQQFLGRLGADEWELGELQALARRLDLNPHQNKLYARLLEHCLQVQDQPVPADQLVPVEEVQPHGGRYCGIHR